MVGGGDAWRRRHNATTGRAALRTGYTVFDLLNTGSALAVLFIIFLVCIDARYLRFLRDLCVIALRDSAYAILRSYHVMTKASKAPGTSTLWGSESVTSCKLAGRVARGNECSALTIRVFAEKPAVVR